MVAWTVETLGKDVDDEIEALPVSLQARVLRLLEMVETLSALIGCESRM